jgi:DNA polymerase-3 subunit delta'
LALWIGTRLLCVTPTPDGEPCGACQHCSYASRGAHPDLLWFFPRPRLKDPKPDDDDVLEDLAEGVADRLEKTGVWPAPGPTDALYVPTIRALVHRAVLTPALAARKVIAVGDAHMLAPQESMSEASNAFLKLLEEPLADTTIILTSSLPSALLPTIRSRVSAVRVPPLSPSAASELAALGVKHNAGDAARTAATAMLDAATRDAQSRYRYAFGQGAAGARGGFAESLDALTKLLHERARVAATRGDERAAAGAARGMELVERTKQLTRQNINPQLLSATLLDELAPLVS